MVLPTGGEMTHKLLFIVKRREDYSDHESYSKQGVSTGLWNSARLVVEMLNKEGIEAKLIEVIDNNCIDRAVTAYRPTDVIIEALWVVPEKFEILTRLHPNVRWNVRLHSELPFMANEGIAMKWISAYVKYPNVSVSANSPRMLREVTTLLTEEMGWTDEELDAKVFYTPNYYMPGQIESAVKTPLDDRASVNICCFGAIRPLKNQLIQAVAALKFATSIGKQLNFHVNSGRVENKGDPVYHNLVAMFDNLKCQGHQLIQHQWMPHKEFLEVIKQMDMGLQVSYTETFNIVSADLVACRIPTVVSNEVSWMVPYYANPNSSEDIFNKMRTVWGCRAVFTRLNIRRLKAFSYRSAKVWKRLFG
jgi:hypothetical protein